MSCLINNGIPLKCKDNNGGVSAVYIANYTPGLQYSFNQSDRFRSVSTSTNLGITTSAYNIAFTEPNISNPTLPANFATGSVVTISFDDLGYASLNGTQSVTFVVRNSGNGSTTFATDRLFGTNSATSSLISTIGTVTYPFVTNEINLLPNIPFYTLTQPVETANFEQQIFESVENGTTYYQQSTIITLSNMKNTKQLTDLLGIGTWLLLIKDNNGNYWISGYDGGARVESVSGGTGKTMTDLNGSVVTFISKGKQSYKVKADAAIARIIN